MDIGIAEKLLDNKASSNYQIFIAPPLLSQVVDYNLIISRYCLLGRMTWILDDTNELFSKNYQCWVSYSY